jgi:hypothetical protein
MIYKTMYLLHGFFLEKSLWFYINLHTSTQTCYILVDLGVLDVKFYSFG